MSTRPAAKASRRSHAQQLEEADRRLLDAALAIVAQRGSLCMRLAEVCQAAGYSRVLAAHRFGNKGPAWCRRCGRPALASAPAWAKWWRPPGFPGMRC